ncbi:MAG TPA: CPBP family glutamic-type intramembrane protease [Planctomycetota bacterium]|nr:CPBP family glutamic-type intramembrane protease [Planctomycetota bacterium]
MDWTWAALAPALTGAALVLTGRAPAAIALYHLLCAVRIFRHRRRVLPLLRWNRSAARWSVGATLLVVPFLLVAPFVVNPAPYKELFLRTVFATESPGVLFPFFAAYTLVIHAPLEEIFWRGAVTDPDRAGPPAILIGNAALFGLLHAVPLGILLGLPGILLGLPTAAAGAVWAWVTLRSGSLWPALLSHGVADALLLLGMWFFFVR